MIVKMVRDHQDRGGYHYIDTATNQKIAWAGYVESGCTGLRYGEHHYEFPLTLKKVPKAQFNCPYPIATGGKNSFGWPIMLGADQLGYYYGEAITCRKKWIFKRNIGVTVFMVAGRAYQLYRVGFADEPAHYYEIFHAGNTSRAGEEINEAIDKVTYKIGHCYSNTQNVVRELRKAGFDPVPYAGWLFVGEQLPIHHCWAVVNGNVIVDLCDDFPMQKAIQPDIDTLHGDTSRKNRYEIRLISFDEDGIIVLEAKEGENDVYTIASNRNNERCFCVMYSDIGKELTRSIFVRFFCKRRLPRRI